MLDLEAIARAESTNDVKTCRVREDFPENQLTFPVKEGAIKTLVLGILEDATDYLDGQTSSSEDMLAQTPHDVARYREFSVNARGRLYKVGAAFMKQSRGGLCVGTRRALAVCARWDASAHVADVTPLQRMKKNAAGGDA